MVKAYRKQKQKLNFNIINFIYLRQRASSQDWSYNLINDHLQLGSVILALGTWDDFLEEATIFFLKC